MSALTARGRAMVKGAAVAEQPTGTPRLTVKRVEDNSDE